MSHGRAPGYPWVMSHIVVSNIERMLEFYHKAFGFEASPDAIKGPDGKIVHAEMRYKDWVLMLGLKNADGRASSPPAETETENPASFYIYTHDIDTFVQHAANAGAQIQMEPTMMFWGDRIARLKDIDGYTWVFATHVTLE